VSGCAATRSSTRRSSSSLGSGKQPAASAFEAVGDPGDPTATVAVQWRDADALSKVYAVVWLRQRACAINHLPLGTAACEQQRQHGNDDQGRPRPSGCCRQLLPIAARVKRYPHCAETTRHTHECELPLIVPSTAAGLECTPGLRDCPCAHARPCSGVTLIQSNHFKLHED
jgi:hypothetical protein